MLSFLLLLVVNLAPFPNHLPQAVSAERMNCIVRFASFLQHNGSTLCTSFPELFAPQGGCAARRGGLGAGALPLRIPQQQQQQPQWGCGAGPGSSGAASPLESLLASAANNNGCLGASPPSAGAAFASLGFAPAGPAKFFGSGGLAPLAARPQAAGAAPDLFSTLLDGGEQARPAGARCSVAGLCSHQGAACWLCTASVLLAARPAKPCA